MLAVALTVSAILLTTTSFGPVSYGRAYANDDLTLAKAHFEIGRVHFEKGEFRQAVDEFLVAQKYAPRPQFDFNLARSYERLADAPRAIFYYQRYLSGLPNADDRGEVETTVERLRQQVGRIHVQSAVANLQLTVDGAAPIMDGEELSVVPGLHLVVGAHTGYSSASASVVAPTGSTVPAQLDLVPVAAVATSSEDHPRKRKLALALGLTAAAVVVVGLAVGLSVGLSSTHNNWSQETNACKSPSCVLIDGR